MDEDPNDIVDTLDDPNNEGSTFVTGTETVSTGDEEYQCHCDLDDICLDFWWFIFNLISIVTYVLDVGSDISLAVKYYLASQWSWFALTITFVLLPTIMMTGCNVIWYIDVKRRKSSPQKRADQENKRITWVLRATSVMFQFAPVLRYVTASAFLVKMWKSKSKTEMKQNEEMAQREETDSSILRLFECFLEAIPQLCLQLFIMCSHHTQSRSIDEVLLNNATVIMQWISMLTSLLSALWALCAYHRKLHGTKINSSLGTLLQVCWHLLILSSRIIAISISATYFKEWIFLLILSHWLVMLFWIIITDIRKCHSSCKELLFDILASWAYIFYFFNLETGRSPWRYLLYYSIVYIENAAMVIIWFHFTQGIEIWYHTHTIVFVFAGFFIGVLCQSTYYIYFHRNDTIVDVLRENFKGDKGDALSNHREVGKKSTEQGEHLAMGCNDDLELDKIHESSM